MHISRGHTIAGQPATVIRNAFRRLRDAIWTSKTIALYLKVSPADGHKITGRLKKLGYIEPHISKRRSDEWSLTNSGNALANANAAPPLPREAARRLLEEFLERVMETNSNSHFLYRVRRVILFGSYLTDKARLGDIDIALSLKPKERDQDRFMKLVSERSRRAIAEGRRFSTFVDEITWPEQEVRRFLKGRSRYLSFHSDSDGILKECPKRLLFDSTREPTRSVASSSTRVDHRRKKNR